MKGEGVIRRRADSWLFIGLLILIIWMPIPRGSNRLWAVSMLELWVFLLAGAWLLLNLSGGRHVPDALLRARPILFLWLAWLALIALQLVPLPVGLLEVLSPRAAETHGEAAAFLGRTAGWFPISVYPGETWRHLIESAAYLCLFSLVLATVDCSRRLRIVAMTVVLSGLFQALYGTMFLLSGAEQGLFFDTANRFNAAAGTFVNRNHLAGYLEITTAVGIGLVLSGLDAGSLGTWRARLRYLIDFLLSPTIRNRIFVAIMVIALILTRSRTGNVAFFASLAIAGVIFVVLRDRRYLFRATLVFATLFLVDLWLLGTWFGVEEVAKRLEATEIAREMRVVVWPGLVSMAHEYWLTGSGLGTFAAAFPPFRPEAAAWFHDHAHNDYMQFLIETGIVGTALIAGIVLLVLRHCLQVLRVRRDRLAAGIAFSALMAMTAIAIHSVTDFNLQIPANAATLIVVMGLTMVCSPRSRRRHRSEPSDTEGSEGSPVPDAGE